MLRAVAFDAYGTLFDVHSVAGACEQAFPGRGAALTQLWRTRQLQYSWLRSMMGRYENFRLITQSALASACAELQLPPDPARQAELMAQYLRLSAFPDVRPALAGLSGYRRVIFSNGEPGMLHAAVEHAGLADLIEAVISVDEVRRYKPDPRVYALLAERLALPPEEVLFVSSNGWDAVGARNFGFRTAWVNRTGSVLEDLGLAPDMEVRLLTEVSDWITGTAGR